ncbi:MAG: serine hydrolase [Sediminibacterium sp.]
MKKIIVILALTGAVFNGAIGQQQNASSLSTKFDKVLGEQFRPDEPGVAVLVSKNGQVIYKKATGMANIELNVPMQTDQIFRIGSITKQFTAVSILQLVEKGKLTLQDEITKFIPDYPTQNNTITIEHLLTHTSGIQDFTAIKGNEKRNSIDYSPKENIDYFKNEPMRFATGTRHEYSNSNYVILGYIIEQLTGKTYGQYLEENIFKPLGMNNSSYASESRMIKNRAAGYTQGEKGIENASYINMGKPYAAGAILSTVMDLFTWNQAMQSNKLLKKESFARALTRYKLLDGTEVNYGYGWRMGYVLESPNTWHGGLVNGFFSMAMYLPKEDVYVVVLTNCDCKSPVSVTEKLAALAVGKPYDYKAMPVDNSILTAYTGVYENTKGQQTIISSLDSQLYFQSGRAPKANIKAFQQEKFFFPNDPMITIEFIRNKNSADDKLVVHSRTANEVWTKTNKPIASKPEIKIDEKILETYTGEYEVNPDFSFIISKEQEKLFLKARGQEKVEIFAEAANKFFLKVNGALLEFVKDDAGKVIKAILTQGGRQTDAKKIK